MRSPVRAAGCAALWDDGPRYWCIPLSADLSDRGASGDPVWFSAASAAPVYDLKRSAVSACFGGGISACGFRSLRRGSAAGLFSGTGGGRDRLGADDGPAAAAGFYLFLEEYRQYFGFLTDSGQKIFKKTKNYLCNLEKIGYNKMVLPSESAAEDRR